MPLTNKDIHNILSIQFENISKYLKYDDYYVFYQLYAPKNINKLIRKCIYCNNIPVCPISICYKRYNIKKICNESLLKPICYICAIDNWVHKYNKLSYKNKLINGNICPYKCCNFNSNHTNIINRRDECLFNFNNSWKYLKKIPYYRCKYCGLVFKNKYNYDIYKHLRTSTCRIIVKKMISGSDNIGYESESESNSDSDYESDFYE